MLQVLRSALTYDDNSETYTLKATGVQFSDVHDIDLPVETRLEVTFKSGRIMFLYSI